MKPIKLVVLACGVLGILATFLPYISMGEISMKFWDLHSFPAGNSGLLNGPHQVYLALIGFAVAAALGLQALAAKRLARGVAIGSALGFLAAFATEGVHKGLLGGGEGASTAIGGKLLFLSAAVGLIASIIAVIKPEPA